MDDQGHRLLRSRFARFLEQLLITGRPYVTGNDFETAALIRFLVRNRVRAVLAEFAPAGFTSNSDMIFTMRIVRT